MFLYTIEVSEAWMQRDLQLPHDIVSEILTHVVCVSEAWSLKFHCVMCLLFKGCGEPIRMFVHNSTVPVFIPTIIFMLILVNKYVHISSDDKL